MKTTPHRTSLVAGALLFTIAACGGSDDGTADTSADEPVVTESTAPANDAVDPETAGGTTVGISKSRYDPKDLKVSVGDTVTFTNTDAFAHTVTSAEGQPMEFASGNFKDGETFELTFDESGTFAYFCEIHPTMRATVNVG